MNNDESTYYKGVVVVAPLAFFGIWIYAFASWGFLIGLAIGWLPALVGGLIIGLLWPVVGLLAIGLLLLILGNGGL